MKRTENCRAVCGGRRDQRFERLIEVARVVEPRQVVADRELAKPLLARAQPVVGALAVGRVDAGRDDLDQPPLGVDDRRVPPGDPDALAVAAHVLVLVRDVALGMLQEVVDHRDEVASRRLGVRHDEPQHRVADDLVARVAEEASARSRSGRGCGLPDPSAGRCCSSGRRSSDSWPRPRGAPRPRAGAAGSPRGARRDRGGSACAHLTRASARFKPCGERRRF